MEIRHGRMTREEGIQLVRLYDHVRPRTLDTYLRFMQISEEEFLACIEPMRDRNIWEKDGPGQWRAIDSVANHLHDPLVEAARVSLVPPAGRTFGANNLGFYWQQDVAASRDWQDVRGGRPDDEFIVL